MRKRKTFPCDSERSLIQKTRELLKAETDISWLFPDFPPYWLLSFRNGSSGKSASVNRVQALFEKLSGKPLL